MTSERGVTASTLAARCRRGESSVEAVVTDHLERIAARDRDVRAFLRIESESALARARALDAAKRARDPIANASLFGVPIALKDNLCLRGSVTTAGSRILEGWRAPYDAHVVERLHSAGAVIVGKTNLDEFAMGSSTEHSAFHATRNPWDLERVPGGSSGGSAAAVAAGMTPLALGSDTGGSIRQPAAFCGVVGFKPTYGRVSRYGLIAFASSLDQIGPIGTRVDDVALAYSAIAGHDPKDATSLRAPLDAEFDPPADSSRRRQVLSGLRVGVHRDYVDALTDPEMKRAVLDALARLASAGASLVRVDDVDLLTEHALAVYYVIATSEASSNLARFDGMRYGPRELENDLLATYSETRGKRFGEEVARRIVLGTFALSAGHRDAWYQRALDVRAALRAAYAAAFSRVDVLIGAVSPISAFPLGANVQDPLTMYLCDTLTVPASLAGLPALSVPIGLTQAGLPIGVQVIGPCLADERVLAVGAALESLFDFAGRIAPPATLGASA